MVAESDNNVTITWDFNENGVPFISANVNTNCETSPGISSVYSSMTGTQVIKFTQRPPPDTMCRVTVHVANLLGSIDRQYFFTVQESKCIVHLRSAMHYHLVLKRLAQLDQSKHCHQVQFNCKCVSLTAIVGTCMSMKNCVHNLSIATQNLLSQLVKHQ